MLKETITDKRKERHTETQEDFTPESFLEKYASEFFESEFKDPESTFLDNSCGNGNMILYIIKKKLDNGSTYLEALQTVFGIDLMKDNIKECHERIKMLLEERNIKYKKREVNKILKTNIVCWNALYWDYKNWKPLPKPKKSKKPKQQGLF